MDKSNTFKKALRKFIRYGPSNVELGEANDRIFFVMCEYLLAEPRKSPRFLPTRNQRIIFIAVRHFGLFGLLICYLIMISRSSRMHINCVGTSAIFDIRGMHISSRNEILGERHEIALKRRHFPSRRILREIWSAHRRYQQLSKVSKCNKSISESATLNEMYLYWLLIYYVYRSIIQNNANVLKSKISRAVTSFHPTPEINGCLSMLSDLGIPLIAYISHKIITNDLYLYSLSFFDKVVVKHGSSMQLLTERLKTAVLLEERSPRPIRSPLDKEQLTVAVFLSSFYTLNDVEVERFVTHGLVPSLLEFQNRWRPLSIRIFCHPNDARPEGPLLQFGFDTVTSRVRPADSVEEFSVVLAGNTTAIEEALAAGVPVIYCGNLDSFEYDLLGYVSDGIVFDGTNKLPHEEELVKFYTEKQTMMRLQHFLHGCKVYPSIRFIDIFCPGST